MDRGSTVENLARNLAFLLKNSGMSYRDVATKTGGRVSPKTVGNMVNRVGAPTIDNVELVAQVFGLNGWHLISPNLVSDLTTGTSISRLHAAYLRADEAGRRHIERVAEREAEYRESGHPHDDDTPSPSPKAKGKRRTR